MSDTFAPMNNRLSPSLRVAKAAMATVMTVASPTMERDATAEMMMEWTLLMDAAHK